MRKILRLNLPTILLTAFVVYILGWTLLSKQQYMNVRQEDLKALKPNGILMEKQKRNKSFIRLKDVFVSVQRKYAGNRHNSVTLVTQTSIDKLHLLEPLSKRWNGPISVAIFINRENKNLIELVNYYYQCFSTIQANTSFHFVCPEGLDLSYSPLACDKYPIDKTYNSKPVDKMEYPHNMVRNLAIPDVKEGFIFCIDIDMLPSWNLHDKFLNYVSRLRKPTLESSIFIVPAFESNQTDDLPTDRRQLIQGISKGKIQNFHENSCANCQFDTNYKKWLNMTSPLISTYRVKKTFCSYEPFYIMTRKKYILYDERFVGRGYDRISQVCEVWMAGFNFFVLSDVFIVHRGFHAKLPPLPTETTLSPDVYKERHLDFLREKYLRDAKYRKKLKNIYNETVIRNIERRLSINDNLEQLRSRNTTSKIDWAESLKGNDKMQYQWYMKFGEKGPDINKYIDGEWRKSEQTYGESQFPWESEDDPRDPNKVTFYKFLQDKWKQYSDDSRKTCKV